MIPILYGTTEGLFSIGDKFADNDNDILYSYEGDPRFDYDTLGIGALTDTISCLVHEVRNGQYELTMTYPISGIRYENIREGAIIKAIPAKNKNAELFRIYAITKPINGIIEIHAEHISYQLSSIPVMPFEADSLATALLGLKSNSAESNPFTFWTDKSVASPYRQKVPASCRARLGGEQGSILDTYGGEFEFVGYTVKLWNARGTDRGVQLRYGKNIVDLTQETNIADTVTGICPYWASEDGVVVTLPENVISSMKANSFPYHRTVVVDFSGDFEEQPTVDQLRARAQKYIESEGIGIPKVSIEVSFVDLSASDDFSNKGLLEQVNLCDTVTVIFEPYGIEAKSKVVETMWDVLRDRYESITLGTVTTNLASIVSQDAQNTKNEIAGAKTNLQAAIDHATDQITGVTGGYVVINRDANGDPYELLVMNTPNIDTATRVWRWNQNGLGVSNNGYAGPYETAMTADGHFVADFITAGTLQSVEIIAELGKIGGWTIGATQISKGITVGSAKYTPTLNAPDSPSASTGAFYISKLLSGVTTYPFKVDYDGTLHATGADISGTITSNNATITGGSINIATASDTDDAIKLTYVYNTAEYEIELSPGELNIIKKYYTTSARTQLSSSYQLTCSGQIVHLVRHEYNSSGVEIAYSDTRYSHNGVTICTKPSGDSPTVATLSPSYITLCDGDLDTNVERVRLSRNGLFFYNSSGTPTNVYSA